MSSLEALRSQAVADHRFTLVVLVGFGLIAAGLTLVGVGALVAFAVRLRTREWGIRLALGAEARDVRRLMMRHGLVPAFWGVGAGWPLAILASRAFAGFLFGVRPTQAALYAGVASALLATAAFACTVPAWRAGRIDPGQALRVE